jgi:prephenate dehydrogenase
VQGRQDACAPRLSPRFLVMHFSRIVIVGVGLIGGSFALAARRAGFVDRITGWDIDKEALNEAVSRGIIDGIEDTFDTGKVCQADLVYLAAPVGAILNFLRNRANSMKPGTVVTDAGSTKREICRVAAEALPERVSFVGGHPMAGSHNAGVRHANVDLFCGAPYALVVHRPEARSANEAAVEELVRAIGGRPVEVSAEEHDQIVARVSHAPQLLATALACAAARHRSEADLRLAGSGFAEMVRLAASSWSMWEDICRTNADQIAVALDEVISEMDGVRSSVAGGEFDGLRAVFEEANELVRRLRSSADGDDS